MRMCQLRKRLANASCASERLEACEILEDLLIIWSKKTRSRHLSTWGYSHRTR